MTCWRRLRDWQVAGVWQVRHEMLWSRLNGADSMDWLRASVDSASIRAVGGGKNRPQHRGVRDGSWAGSPAKPCAASDCPIIENRKALARRLAAAPGRSRRRR